MRHTPAHSKNRRSHHSLKGVNLAVCTNCGEHHRPHHMCLNCGFYKGRVVIDLVAKKQAREARIKAKEERIKAELGETEENETSSTEEKAEEKK